MVDVDGVIVRAPTGGWAVNMDADLGLSADVLQRHFFTPHWNDVVLGRAALHDRLAPVLAEHAPHLTSHQVAAYWFDKDADLDAALLADLAHLRARGVAVHLATVQEHERASYLWNTMGLRDHFDGLHYAALLGWKKTDPEFYAAVEARTGLDGEDLVLLDDTASNLDVARAAGWGAMPWDGTMRLSEVLATVGPRI